MQHKEYRKILEKLGLTIVGAAPVFGVSRRHAQRFASGERPITIPIRKLLQLMLQYGIKPEKLIEMNPKKP